MNLGVEEGSEWGDLHKRKPHWASVFQDQEQAHQEVRETAVGSPPALLSLLPSQRVQLHLCRSLLCSSRSHTSLWFWVFYSLCLIYVSLLCSFWKSIQFLKTQLRCSLLYGCFPAHTSPVLTAPSPDAQSNRFLPLLQTNHRILHPYQNG